jgi:predicted nucleic acid-binding protein
MIVVDSSGWLEYIMDGPNAAHFERALRQTDQLLIPAICVYEVFKRLLQTLGEEAAQQAAARMKLSHMVDVTEPIAIEAALLSVQHRLPMADAIILATARHHRAELWTQDADFERMEGVKYVAAA